jgi:hypothetical protein
MQHGDDGQPVATPLSSIAQRDTLLSMMNTHPLQCSILIPWKHCHTTHPQQQQQHHHQHALDITKHHAACLRPETSSQ